MCAQYLMKFDGKFLFDQVEGLSERVDIEFDLDSMPQRITPHTFAPAIVHSKDRLRVLPMRFALLPAWSKEPKVKFATHNARLETIQTKATWRVPFAKNHCAIPMSHFIEPIYEGELAGNMVQFHSKKNELLWATGIYDTWTDPQTGEIIDSFAIITGEPSSFVRATGHDRQPVFLQKEKMLEWLHADVKDSDSWTEYLTKNSFEPDFEVGVDRPLKPGWEKRR